MKNWAHDYHILKWAKFIEYFGSHKGNPYVADQLTLHLFI